MSPKPPNAAFAITAEPIADDPDGKIARLGIKRDLSSMYYIKNGDVWAVARKAPGKPAMPAFIVATAGIEMDYETYLYYLDNDGDVARKQRQR